MTKNPNRIENHELIGETVRIRRHHGGNRSFMVEEVINSKYGPLVVDPRDGDSFYSVKMVKVIKSN